MMQGTSSRTTFWCAVKQRVLQIDTKAPYLDCNFGFSVLHIEAPWPMHSPSCRSCPPLTPLVTSVVISESGRPGPLDQGLVSGWQTYSNATQCIYHFWTVFSQTGRCWRKFFQSFKYFMADHWGCWTFWQGIWNLYADCLTESIFFILFSFLSIWKETPKQKILFH